MTKTALDIALEPHQVEGALYDTAIKDWGSTLAQAEDFSKLHRGEFHLENGFPTHTASGLPANHKDCFALIAKKYPHLVPPPFEVSIADVAFIENNFAARGKLVNEMGERATLDLAKRYGHETLHSKAQGKRPASLDAPIDTTKKSPTADRAANPFSCEGWNLSRQGSLVKSLGLEKTAQIARAVGCKLGDTKPNPKF
jgi:hypothetical protein